MELPRYESFSAFAPEGLPSDDEVLALVDRMIDDLHALRDAPVVAPYAGPAIEQCRMEDAEFGLYFEDVQGGFTITGRTIPNAFNVLPIMRVPHLHRWTRRTRARRGSDRHTAHRLQPE